VLTEPPTEADLTMRPRCCAMLIAIRRFREGNLVGIVQLY